MARVNANPLFSTDAQFLSVEKFPAGSDKNKGNKDKYQVSFVPTSSLVNGTYCIDADISKQLGVLIRLRLTLISGV